jgi:integrase
VPAERKGARVVGPRWIEDRQQWRVITYLPDGRGRSRHFGSEADAHEYVALWTNKLARLGEVTVELAIDRYEEWKKAKRPPREFRKGQQDPVDTTVHRLRTFFGPVLKVRVASLTAERCKELYAGKWDGKALLEHGLVTRPTRAGRPLAVDTQRNTLLECKTFGRWWVTQGWRAESPLEDVEGEGARNHGGKGRTRLARKEQKRLFRKAVEIAQDEARDAAGRERALGLLTQLMFATRSSDVISRQVRHVDLEDWEFEVKDGKTPASDRTFVIPKFMRPMYRRQMQGKREEQYLFGAGDVPHDRDWVRDSVHFVCKEAGVKRETAHGLKGAHAELARDSGVTPDIIAKALAHTSYKGTTRRSYQSAGADDRATQQRVLKVLVGGKKR